jgi:hypothetical protein
MTKEISRRTFLKRGTAAAIGLSVAPNIIVAGGQQSRKKNAKVAASDKLNILGVGIGGRGAANLAQMETENIIGLCDVDWKYADHVFKKYPQAKKYNDYRVMFDEMLNEADAVMVATADHTHAIIAAQAMAAGKHVYVEKPLTLTVYEARLLTKLAKKHRVATQMGNQGASSAGTRQAIEWLWNGEIGEVKRVDCFTDRPIWPQGLERPEEVMEVPSTLNWDAFLGPAPFREYNSIYTPWNFRGWWDFGTGAMGDMACHIMHVPFKGLKLLYPTQVEGSSTDLLTDCCPSAEMMKLVFPARPNMPKLAMPEVEIRWYDGGFKPERPEGLPAGFNLNIDGGASIFYGSKDIMVVGCYGNRPMLISGRKPEVPQMLREVTLSHQQDWIRACKEDPDSRVPASSDFSEAGPFVEMVDVGVAAVRLQGLNQVLDWDGDKMEFTNIPEGATVRILKKNGFTIRDGHPTFNNEYTDPIDAKQFAASLIRREYREGYTLPEMPE